METWSTSPSYEIITGPGSAGRYYAPDLREVRDVGVAHVMRIFEQHFIRGDNDSAPAPIVIETMTPQGDIVCDEDVIEAALEMSRVDMRVGDEPEDSGFNLSERDVREGYRLFLGREPESQAAVDAHRKHASLSVFRATLLRLSGVFEAGRRGRGCTSGQDSQLGRGTRSLGPMAWVTASASLLYRGREPAT